VPHIGYFALILGLMLEGETSIITGSFLAHRGYFHLPWVYGIGVITSLCIDWGYFFMARIQGKKFIANRPKLTTRLNRLTSWVEKRPIALMIFYRFIYGVRIPLLIVFGLSTFNVIQFLSLSIVSICLWVSLYVFLGYYFGAFLEANFERLKEHELGIILLLIVIVSGIFYLIKRKEEKTS
jgi:membrane protein DedA with SNARE-associated domain